MKTLIRRYFCLVLVLLLVWGCSEKWNGVDPNAVGDFEIKGLTLDNSLSRQIYKWLSTPRAKDIIDESGYISIR